MTDLNRASSVRQLYLDNGLQVTYEEDHRQPLVAIEVRIKGGLRGEGRYLGTGITHFIEHMLFKGTPSRPAGTIDQEVRRYGGSINAFTSFDTTGVSLFVESRYLKEALGMLADILQNAVFEQAEFDKERPVIVSEIQMNLDDPDRRLYKLFWSRHFLEHPYRHPILGHQELLESLTPKDLADFYAAQYHPQNIVIACVGDLNGATFPQLAKELFGGWARGTLDPEQSLVAAEPPSVAAKEATVELPVQSAYVMMGFTSTRLSDPDVYPLDVLASVLGDGRSSRLYDEMVQKRQLAHAIDAWNYTPYDPGVFAVSFRTDAEKVSAARQAVLELIEQVKSSGVTDAELQKAKRTVLADYLFGRQTIEAQAGDFAGSLMATGDPLFSQKYVEGIQRVTAGQVQDAARRYCNVGAMTTAVIRPQALAPAPVAAAAAKPISVDKSALPNGMTMLIGADRHLPIATIVAAFRGGVRVEQAPQQGLSNLTAQMLIKGTARKSSLQIARQIESLGGSVEPFSGRDGFGLVMQLLAQDVNEGIALMHELIGESAFPELELEVQRELILKQLQAQDDEIFDVGTRLLRQSLFGQHPYRFQILGDKTTVATLTREDCLRFFKQWVVPSNGVIGVFGDVDPAAVSGTLTRSFGALSGPRASWPQRLEEPALAQVAQTEQAMDREQALILMGFRGSAQAAEDRDAIDVMTAVLSGMAGRLFQAIREEHGLSYTLGAVHAPAWDPGYIMVYAATRPEERAEVLRLLEAELRLAASEGFAQEEVDQAKRYLIGNHRIELQSLSGVAKRCTLDELLGLGYDRWKTYESRINAIDISAASEAAKRYLTVDRRAQVVVVPGEK